uniref:Small subunit of meta-cleavage enzyme n=1 Tax=carbazole-degrading bacterium OC13S TaxID=586730 RepID=C4B8G9_UNCXX|nr:small subunit of meta-cleavage enzyme [carbazole-degrading bacterium OC13S]
MTEKAPGATRLIEGLFREPGLMEALQTEPEKVYEKYSLTDAEKEALRDGSFSALGNIGVHPVLRMHYQMVLNPDMANHVTIRDFLSRLEKEKRNG